MPLTINDAHLGLAYRLGESAVPTDTTELARRLNWFKTCINIVCGGDELFWFMQISPHLTTAATDVTVVDQQEYSLPTRFRKFNQIKVDGYKYEEIPQAEVHEKFEKPSSVVPILPGLLDRRFYLFADRVWFIPTPADTPASTTITLTGSGTTATATATDHGYKENEVVVVAGATPSGYNGTFRILTVTANTFTYTIASGLATPATGTITAKKNNILMWYYEMPTEPTGTGSTIEVPDEYIDLLEAYAEGRYWSYAHKRGKAADAFTEFTSRLNDLKKENFRRKFLTY